MSIPDRPKALDNLLAHIADNLPAEQAEAEATAKARAALEPLEAKLREHKAQEHAQVRRDALLEGADAVFVLGFDQCGHGDTEFVSFQHAWDLGTIDAARALRRLAKAPATDPDRAVAALAKVRSFCQLVVDQSIRTEAINQARDTLDLIDSVMNQEPATAPETPS